jgi:hypothetical protein
LVMRRRSCRSLMRRPYVAALMRLPQLMRLQATSVRVGTLLLTLRRPSTVFAGCFYRPHLQIASAGLLLSAASAGCIHRLLPQAGICGCFRRLLLRAHPQVASTGCFRRPHLKVASAGCFCRPYPQVASTGCFCRPLPPTRTSFPVSTVFFAGCSHRLVLEHGR